MAVAGFEQAALRAPDDPEIQSDLSAAYFVRSQERDDPNDLLLALSAAEKAVALSGLPEARFNRALILEALFLPEDARLAWQDYLKMDGDSAWAEEAKEHADALEQPSEASLWEEQRRLLESAAAHGDLAGVRRIVDQYRQAAREYAEQEILGEWAEEWKNENLSKAKQRLRVARLIGEALVSLQGERLVVDAVRVVEQAVSIQNERRLNLLVNGYLEYSEGFKLYKKYDAQRALVRLEAARDALARAGSPLAWRAAFFHACGVYHLDRISEASLAFHDLWNEVEDQPYPTLLGHIAWMQGLMSLVQGDTDKGLSYYQKAQALFRSAGELENSISVNSLLAEQLDHLGRSRGAWRLHYRSLREAHRLRDPQLYYLVFIVAAHSVLQQVGPSAALYLQNEVVRHAGSNPVLSSGAFYWRGFMHSLAGHSVRAMRDLAKAREINAKQDDEDIARSLEADLDMIEGSVTLDDPERAVALLSSALRTYEQTGNNLQLLRAYLARARASRRMGNVDLAEIDLMNGLAVYENLGQGLKDEEVRLAYIERLGEIFDEMIDFQASERKRLDIAFAYADRVRTRALPAAVSRLDIEEAEKQRLLGQEPEPLSLDGIRKALPEGTVLIQYSVLPDSLLIWVVRREGFWAFRQRISRGNLQAQISRVARDVKSHSRWEQSAAELHQMLIAPWRSRMRQGDVLVFVPDKELNQVPFSCLRNPDTGLYLIENHEVAVSPSATLYVEALARDRAIEKRNPDRRMLVVGNPTFDRRLFPDLDPLLDAEAEAVRIAEMFPGSRLLRGDQADSATFADEAPLYRIIHFAGHAIANERNPLLSTLVLAPSSDLDSGVVYARDVYAWRLDNTQLVVLSACSTAEGGTPEGEGSTNLARAFLAAGAPTVIASLWNVNDETTAQLFRAFYERMRAGEEPRMALRSAQLRLLKQQGSPSSAPAAWGSFALFGSGTY